MAKRKRVRVISINNEAQQPPTAPENSVQSMESFHTGPLNAAASEESEGTLASLEESHEIEQEIKKVRGPTRMDDVWNLESGQRVDAKLNEFGLPIGDEACMLTRFLGTLVKMPQHVPINFFDWRKVPRGIKDDLWSIVKEKFSFDPETPATKKWVIADLGKKWKSWKHELKSCYFDSSNTVDEILAKVTDRRVNKDQLKDLARCWVNPDYQKLCQQKQNSRNKLEEPHCTGTKSFARISDEERKKNNGVPPSRTQMYMKSRTKKNGHVVNAKAAEVMENLKLHMEHSSNSSGSVGVKDWTNDEFSKVKGPEKRGYIRCIGRIPTVKTNVGASSEETQALKSTVEELKDTLAQTQGALAQTQGLLVSVVNSLKSHLPEANLSSIVNNLNLQVPNDLVSGTNQSSSENEVAHGQGHCGQGSSHA